MDGQLQQCISTAQVAHKIAIKLLAEIDSHTETDDAGRCQGEGGCLARFDGSIVEIVSGGKGYQVAAKVVGSVGTEAEITV